MKSTVEEVTAAPEWLPDKTKFKNAANGYFTQSLFLEQGYDAEVAMYTFNDEDKEYKGKTFKSLKKLYLEMEDPTEYTFANKYLAGWTHWQRIVTNNVLLKEIENWRDELEVRLRSKGVLNALKLGADSFTAAKWAADGHWNVKRGRPSRAEQKRDSDMRRKAASAADVDGARIAHLIPKKQEQA